VSGSARALALLVAAACGSDRGANDCFGVCGPGTRCEAGRCVVAVVAVPEPASTDEPATKGKRRGRGRARAGETADDGAEAAVDDAPLDDDSSVPAHDRNAEQVIDMKAGSERLPDETVRSEMRELEPAFDRCIAAAVGRGAEVPPGKVDFAFAVEPNGKVGGVTVRAPAEIVDAGVIPCLRKALHGHRFPSWDGPRADVDYAFKVE
jgi:hypothetical protein